MFTAKIGGKSISRYVDRELIGDNEVICKEIDNNKVLTHNLDEIAKLVSERMLIML